MGADKPGWYYAGNGQLRYMDAGGWTDRYRPADGSAEPDVELPPSPPDVREPLTRASLHGQVERDPSSFIRLCAPFAHSVIALLIRGLKGLWRLIDSGYRAASANLSGREIAKERQMGQSMSTRSWSDRQHRSWFLGHLIPIAIIAFVISEVFMAYQANEIVKVRAKIEFAQTLSNYGQCDPFSGLTDAECQASFEVARAADTAVIQRGETIISAAWLGVFASVAMLGLWAWRLFRQCPYCFKRVSGKASICRYCGKAVVPTR